MNTSPTDTGVDAATSTRLLEQHVARARARALTALDEDGDAVDRALELWARDLRAHPGLADRAGEVRADAVDAAVRELTGATPGGEPQPPAELVRQYIERFQPAPRFGRGASKHEHLAACRQRALAELDADPGGRGPINAAMSMTQDLAAHDQTRDRATGAYGVAPVGLELEILESLAGLSGPGVLRTEAQVREWIDGFR